jgi:hypothetical protein
MAGELFRRILLDCPSHEVGFGVSGAISTGINRIFGLEHNLVMFIDQ